MRHAALAIVAVALMTTPRAEAQQVQAVIVGPKESAAGDLIILDASQSSGAVAYRWLLVNSGKTFLPIDDGLRCVFASGAAGKYIFVLVVAGTDNNQRLVVSMAEHVVAIGVVPDPDPPGPIPPLPPDPTVPDGAYGLTKFVYSQRAKMPQDDLGRLALFATNYDEVAAKLIDPAGGYLSIAVAKLDIKTKNQVDVDGNREKWLPFFEALEGEMQRLNAAGAFAPEQLSQAYAATAAGLKLIR